MSSWLRKFKRSLALYLVASVPIFFSAVLYAILRAENVHELWGAVTLVVGFVCGIWVWEFAERRLLVGPFTDYHPLVVQDATPGDVEFVGFQREGAAPATSFWLIKVSA